jgi:hypothetical protein
MGREIAFVAAAFIVAAVGGCKKGPATPALVEVEGTIRLDGQPLKHVTVTFSPVERPQRTAIGVTDDSGHYRLTCEGKPGACPGEHLVTIREGPLPQNISKSKSDVTKYIESLGGRPLPRKYMNLVDTPLTANVTPELTTHDFNLER